MKILIVGAGAVGGLFGASMHRAGSDVHFLVRPARKTLLDSKGLTVVTPTGEFAFTPSTVVASDLQAGYDLIILTNKAYALDEAIKDIKPIVGTQTWLLPLLNGVRHLDALDAAFGANRVLGGIAKTIATQADPTRIHVANAYSSITVGPRSEGQVDMAQQVWKLLSGAGIDTEFSDQIMDDMWDKFCRMASLGAANCLLQGTVGEYMRSQSGGQIALQLFHECVETALAEGHPMHPQAVAGYQRVLTNPNSSFNSSMYRDMQAGLPVEGEHLVGDMVRRAQAGGVSCSMLSVALAVLQTYSARLA